MSKKQTSLVKYGDFTAEEAEEEEKQLKDARGPSVFMDMKQPGKYRLRFLPPINDKKWKRVTAVHYIDIPGGDRVSFVCPKMEKNAKCRVCNTALKYLESDNQIDQQKGKNLSAKRRVMANVIDRNNEDEGPKIFAFGIMVEKQLIELRKDAEVGGNFVDPINGFDVVIVRSGTGARDTEYKVHKGKEKPLTDDAKQMKEWIEGQHNLDRRVKVYGDEDIERILNGEKPLGDDTDEEEEKPAKKARSIDQEIDDEDDELDDE